MREVIADATSADYSARLQTAVWVATQDEEIAFELVRELQRAQDVSVFPAVAELLEAMGRKSIRAVMSAIESLELRRPRDVYAGESLLGVLSRVGDRNACRAAAALVDKCAAVIDAGADPALVSLCRAARIRAHSLLAQWGDRSRLDDLIRVAETEGPHLRPEVIEALHELGDRRAVLPLLRCYQALESPAFQDDVKDACLQIMRREGLTPDHPEMAALPEPERNLIRRIWPKGRSNGNGHPDAGPKPS